MERITHILTYPEWATFDVVTPLPDGTWLYAYHNSDGEGLWVVLDDALAEAVVREALQWGRVDTPV